MTAYQYFHRLASGFDVAPALAEWKANPGFLWKPYYRQHRGLMIAQHGLPADRKDPSPDQLRIGSIISEDAYNPECPEAVRLALLVVHVLGAPLIRQACIRAMPPRSRISPHRDNFDTLGGQSRVHLALQCDAKMRFTIRGQACSFQPGELWLCDIGDRVHHVDNKSDQHRIMMMFDVRVPPDELLLRFGLERRA